MPQLFTLLHNLIKNKSMRKISLFACALAVTLSAMASTVDHKGQGMSGADAYSEVTFNYLGDEGPKDDLTAKAVYTFTATADNHLNLSVNFQDLDAAKFIGLVPACYCIIDGIGETPLTLDGDVYTGTTAGTLTEGATYTGFFKRMSSAAWYGGDLLFPFSFTFTKEGGGTVTPDPEIPGNLWNDAVLTDNFYSYYEPGNSLATVDLSNKEIKIVLPVATSESYQADFFIQTGIALTKDKQYVLEYDVLSNQTFDAKVDLSYSPDGVYDYKVVEGPLSLKANETYHFASGVFPCPVDIADALLDCQLGGNPANTTVTFSNFVLKEYVEEVDTNHPGVGMSGDEAYSQVTFNGPNNSKTTAVARYTLTSAADSKLNISVSFENLEPSTVVGLINDSYCIIDGVGETPLTLTDGVYTGTPDATFTEGTTYTGNFKRIASADWGDGGVLFFPFSFTYTADGGSVTPEPAGGNLWDNAVLADNFYNYYAPGNSLATVDLSNKELKFVLPEATSESYEADFFIQTGIALTKDKQYVLEYDVLSNQTYDAKVDLSYSTDGVYDYKVVEGPLSLKANETLHFASGAFTCPVDITDAMLDVQLGGNPANTNLTFSNFVLKEYVEGGDDDDKNKDLWPGATVTVVDPYFAPGWANSDAYTESYSDNELTLDLTPATYERWQAQFGLLTDIKMTADNVYQFSCDITSTKSFTALVKGFQNGNDGNFFCSTDVNLVAGETYHFTVNHITGYNIDPLKLLFDFGGNPADTKITVNNFSLILNPDESEQPTIEPATDKFVFVAPSTPEDGVMVNVNVMDWWNAGTAAGNTGYDRIPNAADFTMTVGADASAAASAGWQVTDFSFAAVFAADYDLVFSIKSTSEAKTMVKLVASKEQETEFNFTRDGDWQTVRMNIPTEFPTVVANGVYEQATLGYPFSLSVANAKEGDTFTVTNVCWVPKGEDRPAYEGQIEVPETMYVVNNGTYTEMRKSGNTFIASVKLVADADDMSSFYFTNMKNESRAAATYYCASSSEALTSNAPASISISDAPGTPFTLNHSGSTLLTLNLDNLTVVGDIANSIDTIEEADNATAVYFNLQGVRVENPSNGIFIRKAGNTVSKVLVK